MKYRVFNFGPTVRIPYKGHRSIELIQNSGITISDPDLAKHLQAQPRVKVSEIIPDGYEELGMRDLITVAAEKGVKNIFGSSKGKLTKLLRLFDRKLRKQRS